MNAILHTILGGIAGGFVVLLTAHIIGGVRGEVRRWQEKRAAKRAEPFARGGLVRPGLENWDAYADEALDLAAEQELVGWSDVVDEPVIVGRPSDEDMRAYLAGEHGPPHPEVVAIVAADSDEGEDRTDQPDPLTDTVTPEPLDESPMFSKVVADVAASEGES